MPASPTAPGRATGGCAGCGRPFLSRLSRVLAQSETDADRLLAIGCLPQRVTVAGNLKFDVRIAEEADATRLLKAIAGGLRLVWRAARWTAKKPRSSKPGRGCSKPIRNWRWFSRRAIQSASPPWLRCWTNRASRGCGAPIGALSCREPFQAAEARNHRPAGHHRRIGLGLLAGLGGLRRRQPDSSRGTQSAGAGAVRRAHRDGSELRQLSAPLPRINWPIRRCASPPGKNWPLS